MHRENNDRVGLTGGIDLGRLAMKDTETQNGARQMNTINLYQGDWSDAQGNTLPMEPLETFADNGLALAERDLLRDHDSKARIGHTDCPTCHGSGIQSASVQVGNQFISASGTCLPCNAQP